METLLQDLRHAWRLLARRPAFTAVAIASLALGIGANATVFRLVDALLLRPLPVADPAHLVAIFTVDQRNGSLNPSAHLNWQDLRGENRSFSAVLGYDFEKVNVSLGSEPTPVDALMVSGNYFDALGIHAAAGRTFAPEDDREGAGRAVAVVSHRFWSEQLGGDRAALGRKLTINNHPFVVIGILPARFDGTDVGIRYDLFVPMAVNRVLRPDPATNWYGKRRGLTIAALGRLKPGVSLAQAEAEMAALSSRLERDYPKENHGRSFKLLPLAQAAINPAVRGAVVTGSAVVLTIVGLVLLIACANVANLLLARAAARRKEMAVRISLGAPRGRIVRQLLTESLLLAVLGGVAGLLLAGWADRALGVVLRSVHLPFATAALDLRMDLRVLAFTFALSLVTGLLFGLVPALQTSRPEMVTALKNQAVPLARAAGRRFGLRDLLVAIQVALSLVALIAAGLFLRSLGEARRTDPGIAVDRLLRVHFNLGPQGYDQERGQLFVRSLVDRLATLPGGGVASAAVMAAGPLEPPAVIRSIFIEGRERENEGGIAVQVNAVTPSTCATLGVPIVRGRALSPADREGAPLVAVINQLMADRLFPKGDAVGQRFQIFGSTKKIEVVGVAKNLKYNSVDEDPQPYIYVSLDQFYTGNLALLVRANGDPAALLPQVEREIRALDRQLPLADAATLSRVFAESLWAPRVIAALLGVFGALALVLATVGIYGIMSFSVAQRAREIGVRMTLGAEPRRVLALVLSQGMVVVAIGLAAGLVGAYAVTRLAAGLLFGVSPTDPLAFGATALLLALVALIATLVPARRATAVDPVLVLREE
jgi:putative ABC transport system permease protein